MDSALLNDSLEIVKVRLLNIEALLEERSFLENRIFHSVQHGLSAVAQALYSIEHGITDEGIEDSEDGEDS